LTFFVQIETGVITLQRNYKIYNFAVTVSPHYLIKLKLHKTAADFEVSCHIILLLGSKNSMNYVRCIFLKSFQFLLRNFFSRLLAENLLHSQIFNENLSSKLYSFHLT